MKRRVSSDEVLHLKLRRLLAQKIYEGTYADGALLPPERDLADEHRMSRVTVRSTLDAMEKEGIISRRQGHGTHVSLTAKAHAGALDICAVIAPAENPFFAEFIRCFEAAAERNDTLVVYKAGGARIEDTVFRCYERGIRSAVIWPYDESIDVPRLARLRGLGMNFVLFDRIVDSNTADFISVDNAHAIDSLYDRLIEHGAKHIAYVGWENDVITSTIEREAAYVRHGVNAVYRLPWRREKSIDTDAIALLGTLPSSIDAVICGNGVIGMAVQRASAHARSIVVACVDDLPGASELAITVYAQPMEVLARTAYDRLIEQNTKPRTWKASTILRKGDIIEHARRTTP
ncbi:MAG: GntR family transcriptional regulator [Spirochaetota bacterium]